MTHEDKNLLFKYLCAALPYRVMIEYNNVDFAETREMGFGSLHDFRFNSAKIKPYLRPMSSMTKEEREEMYNLLSPEGTAIYGNDGIALPLNHCGEFVPYEFMNRIIQYLLEHHFDFIGLIPKDLAIEVTENNNPYESKGS